MGEQPNPWDVLPPQDAMSRHRGAKPPRRCELLGEISLDDFSTQYRQITKTDFRLCSTCRSHSQASFCLCTLRSISDRSEETFVRLRYLLGGDRPSQTARLKMSPNRLTI
ncbi:unnamed protein product [Ectocarpus sp. 12 AP-2014]